MLGVRTQVEDVYYWSLSGVLLICAATEASYLTLIYVSSADVADAGDIFHHFPPHIRHVPRLTALTTHRLVLLIGKD